MRIHIGLERISVAMFDTNSNLTLHIQIKVRGYLDASWQEWFDRLAIDYDPHDDITVLAGNLPDQAALIGVLNQLNYMNLDILSVTQTTKEHSSKA